MRRLVKILNHLMRPRNRPHAFLLLAAGALAMLYYDYDRTLTSVTIVYDGRGCQFRTHQRTVDDALRDAGLALAHEDIVQPELSSSVIPGATIVVTPAVQVHLEVDGRLLPRRTHRRTPAEILAEAGVSLGPYDEVWFAEGPESPDIGMPLPQPSRVESTSPLGRLARPWERSAPPPVRLVVKRAVTIHVDDGGVPVILRTTSTSIGEALREHGIIVYLGDQVDPGLGAPVVPDLRVSIQRSKAVEVMVDGRIVRTRTRAERVGDVLAQQSVALLGRDEVEPAETTPVADGMGIRVTRVSQSTVIEQENIPYETEWRPADELRLDEQRLEQDGAEGVNKRRVRVLFRDGQEVQRGVEDEWVDAEPVSKVIAYGTQITPGTVDTDEGPLTYWRKIRMLATSYSPATSGKRQDHPQYGRTRSGLQVARGVVAVDSKVLALGDRVYVPGYGVAVAGDTGGGVVGRHIDLGFGDDELAMWYRWVDVFVLGPPPSANQIRWVLPNWPRERR